MRPHRTVTAPNRPRWRTPSLVAGSLAALLGLTWASGCSVLYDLSTEQCSSDSDCDALGGVFSGLTCIENLCQEPPLVGCQSNAQCMDDQGSGIEPWACVDRECVPLLTPECPIILPQSQSGELWRANLRSDNPLILAGTGVIENTAVLDSFLMNYELALTELTNKGVSINGRQVVMLGCNALFDSTDELDRMMTHLADEVKVPGMVATFFADDLQRAFTQKGDAANMFFMSAFESDPTVAALQDRGLIWHVGPDPGTLARAYAPLLTRTLQHLGVSAGVKVATVLTSDFRFLANMVPTLESPPAEYGLSFNGKSVADNRRDGTYLGVSIPQDPSASIATQITSLIEFEPTVIISAADRQFIAQVIPAIESQWPDGPPRPFYLLSPINYNESVLRDLVDSNPALITRMAGVNGAAAEDSRAYDAYLGRLQYAFPGAEVAGTENLYDAVYYLLYAAAGAGQLLQNGTNFVTGMNRLLSGPSRFEVGPDDLPQAFGILATGGATIQLDGTLGPPDFNPANGTRQSVGSVWCIDGNGFHADVLRYVPNADPAAATLSGTFPCIPGF